MIILVMGVSGVGKTTVGAALAQELGWTFADADDFHPATNVAKMRAGIPLDDADRAPWLAALRDAIQKWLAAGQSVVLACSALKQSYRDVLVVSPDVKLVYLHADFDLIAGRMTERHHPYMNPRLLQSQFAALEPPSDAISVDAIQPVPQVVANIRSSLRV